jgi:alkylation response protein AidB-like acyl-CoA dehydrogenase
VLRTVLHGLLDHARHVSLDPFRRQAVSRAIIASRLLDLRIEQVVADLAEGRDPGPGAAVTKRLLSDTEQTLLDAAIAVLDLHGTAWTAEPSPWVTAYLYSRAASIYGGSAQIQRNLIGERILGLPR